MGGGSLLTLTFVSATVVHAQTAPTGDPQKGRAQYMGQGTAPCMLCHGMQAEGGFGPDLAGRGLTFDQLKRSVHEPWGIMPAFTHISDEALANIHAYLKSLKPVSQPAPWSVSNPPAGAPPGQVLAVN